MTGQLRITGPAHLIEAVPYLLGFAPSESTVVLGITGKQVVVAARVDLAAGESGAADVLRQLLDQTERVVMIAYTEQSAPQWVRQPTHLVSEALLVTGGRWYSMLCTDPICCPPEGRPLPSTSGTISATAVTLGLAAAGTREDVATSLAPAETVEDAQHRADVLAPIPARDQAWLALDELLADTDRLASMAAQHLDTARHCRQDVTAAAPWFLYAWAQWRLGDGARASIALDYLDAAAPDYRAAELLRSAMQSAINPRTAPSLAELHEHDQLREAVAAALDAAHLPWTRDEDSYTVAGCSVGLNYSTGRPEVWQVDSDAQTDRVAEALASVQVAPRRSQS